MSSGNKLSISICDDNGNLSYQKQFRVRRIIQRGVVDKKESSVSLDLDYMGYVYDSEKGWIADENKTTGKFLLIAEYDSGFENETDINVLIPMVPIDKTENVTTYAIDKITYIKTLSSKFLLYSGTDDEENNPEKLKFKAVKGYHLESADFDSCELSFPSPLYKPTVHVTWIDEPSGDFIFSECAFMTRTLKGGKWLCIEPVEPVGQLGCIVNFKQKSAVGLIKYFIVEVEE